METSPTGNPSEVVDNTPTRILDLLVEDFVEQNIDNLTRESFAQLEPSVIKGIGTVYGFRLNRLGIKTLADLSNSMDFETLADELNIDRDVVLKWLLSADILYNFSKGGEAIRPIVIAGLEGSGKTSLTKTLQSLKTELVHSPTSGLKLSSLSFLGVNIPLRELGGKEEARKVYLEKTEDSLSETMLLLYLIDVTKTTTLNKSLDYLKNLISKLIEIDEQPNVHILLTKYDPEFKHQHDSYIKHAKNRINDVLRDLEWKTDIHNISVFDLPSLIAAFSDLFRDISPISKILASIFRYYGNLTDIFAGFILAENGFIISEWSSRLPVDRRNVLFQEAYQYLQDTFSGENREIVKSQLQGIYLIVEKIIIEETAYYMVSINTQAKGIGNDSLMLLKEQMKPWLKNFFSIGNKRHLPTY
ncbi:MAG: ADP-ribosylation factor-like protein [Candidatus Hodarchaeales archaeon]|jgi:GTPase SAR1 family protein